MGDKKKTDLSGLDEKTIREMRDFASTREGMTLQKKLAGLDPKKVMQAFSSLDKATVEARLKNLNTDKIREAMKNKDFLDKLK